MISMAELRPQAGSQALYRFRPVRDKVLVTNLDGRAAWPSMPSTTCTSPTASTTASGWC